MVDLIDNHGHQFAVGAVVFDVEQGALAMMARCFRRIGCLSGACIWIEICRLHRARKIEPEGTAAACHAVEADASAHGLYQFLAIGETDSRAFDLACFLTQTLERSEYLVTVRFIDAESIVSHLDSYQLLIHISTTYPYRSVRAVVFDCVGDEVGQDLFESGLIRFDVVAAGAIACVVKGDVIVVSNGGEGA